MLSLRVSQGFQALHFLKGTWGELNRWPSLKQRHQPVTGCDLPLCSPGLVSRVTEDGQPTGEPRASGRGRGRTRGRWLAGHRGSTARELGVPGRSQRRGEGHGPRSRGRHERERQRPRGPRPPHPCGSGVSGRTQSADASHARPPAVCLGSVVSYAAARPDPTDRQRLPRQRDTACPPASRCLRHLVPQRPSRE